MTTYTDLDSLGTGGSVEFGCDLSGTDSCQTVIGLYGNPLSNSAPVSGQFLAWDGSQWEPTNAPSGTFTAGGDLSGTSTNQTVIRLQTYSLASTAPTDQQVLLWNNSNNRWEPTTLTFSGDVSGTYPSLTVTKIQGHALDNGALGASQDGYVLTWVNADSEWKASPTVSPVVWAKDLDGSDSSNQYVTRISGDLDSPDYIVTLGRYANGLFQLVGDTATGTTATGIPIRFYGSAGSSVASNPGGVGGTLSIRAGDGGAGQDGNNNGGDGGALTISGGLGGAPAGAGNAGRLGILTINGRDTTLTSTTNMSLTSGFGMSLSASSGGVSLGTDVDLNGTITTDLSTGLVHSTSGTLSSSLLVNADVSASAAIAYSKLNLAGSIVNADVNSSAAIAYSKLNLSGSIVNADVSNSAAIAVSKLAAGTAAQLLLNNSTPTPTWTTISGDITLSSAGAVEVVKIQSNPVKDGTLGSDEDGYVLTWVDADTEWQALPNASGVTFAGDLSGNALSQTVEKIKGTTVTTAGGALATGAVLRVTGVATADWGALDLADTDAVTGVLPKGNQQAQDLAGDVTGNTGASVVEKINGATVVAAGSLTTNHVLKVSGASATTYGYIVNANVDASAAIAYSKLNLSGSIVNADVNASAAIAYSKLNLAGSIVNADISTSAAIAIDKLATGSSTQIIVMNSTVPTWTTVSGDISLGATGATVVNKVKGTTITTAGGSLATGAVLRVTGASTADWGAVDLADSDAVTGVLPKANQANQDLAGDVTGNTGASVVEKLLGKALNANIGTAGAGQDQYSIVWDQASTSYKLVLVSGGSGVTTVAAIDTSPNANGLFISGSNISTQLASASNIGMVSTTTQTLAGAKTLSGTLTTGAGRIVKTFLCNSSLTLGDGYHQVFVDTSAARSITLPAPADGREFWITDVIGTAETNNITLVRNGSEKINGVQASKVLPTNWGSWRVISNGTDWFVTG